MSSDEPRMDIDLAFHAQLRNRLAWPRVAVVAAALITIVGIGLLPGDGAEPEASGIAVLPSASTAPSPAPSTSPRPGAATPRPRDLQPRISPGRYDIATPRWSVHLVIPAGRGVWSATAGGAGVARHPLGETSMNVTLHDVTSMAGVATDLCTGSAQFLEVGPTVEDLTAALANQVGGERSGPAEVMLGGHPATKFVMGIPHPSPCAEQGSDGRSVWWNPGQPAVYAWVGGTSTIYVVDVNGERLVITSQHRGNSAEEIAELDAIVASIDIEPEAVHPLEWLPIGSHSLTVDGVPLAFSVPALVQDRGWARAGRSRRSSTRSSSSSPEDTSR